VGELALPAGSLVLDLASGTGDLCVDLRGAGHRPISVDLSMGMLRADHSGAPRVQADILRLPVPDGAADGVTCGFALRNVADLKQLFVEFARAVRPGGRVSLLEVSEPQLAPLRLGHNFYFRHVVPLLGGLLSNREAYRYLPASTAYLPPSYELVGMLESAGLGDVSFRRLGLGAAQSISATRL
jgi:demethylmenaquinone methyltransferase/2-methoxy-6-polyprenyl-1,4-benzoquinol methylase